jgi:hypothetical protein
MPHNKGIHQLHTCEINCALISNILYVEKNKFNLIVQPKKKLFDSQNAKAIQVLW